MLFEWGLQLWKIDTFNTLFCHILMSTIFCHLSGNISFVVDIKNWARNDQLFLIKKFKSKFRCTSFSKPIMSRLLEIWWFPNQAFVILCLWDFLCKVPWMQQVLLDILSTIQGPYLRWHRSTTQKDCCH